MPRRRAVASSRLRRILSARSACFLDSQGERNETSERSLRTAMRKSQRASTSSGLAKKRSASAASSPAEAVTSPSMETSEPHALDLGPSTNHRSEAEEGRAGVEPAASPSAAGAGWGSSRAIAAPFDSLTWRPSRCDAMASSEGTWPTTTTVSSGVVAIWPRRAS